MPKAGYLTLLHIGYCNLPYAELFTMSSSKTSRDWGLEKTTNGQPVAGRGWPGGNDRSQASTSTSTDTTGSAFSQPGYFKPFPTRSSGPRLRRTPGGLGGDGPPPDAHPEIKLERSRLAVALERKEEERRKREARQDDEVRRETEARRRRRDDVVRPRTAQDWHLLAHQHAGVLHTGTYGLALSMGTATAGYDSLVVGVLPEEAPAGVRTAVLRLGQAMEETGRTLCSQIETEVAASREGREQQES